MAGQENFQRKVTFLAPPGFWRQIKPLMILITCRCTSPVFSQAFKVNENFSYLILLRELPVRRIDYLLCQYMKSWKYNEISSQKSCLMPRWARLVVKMTETPGFWKTAAKQLRVFPRNIFFKFYVKKEELLKVYFIWELSYKKFLNGLLMHPQNVI